MKSHVQALIIGGGAVGASVLYHLARYGWKDLALIERRDLTAGSTWHAAAAFHVVNSDINRESAQQKLIPLRRLSIIVDLYVGHRTGKGFDDGST